MPLSDYSSVFLTTSSFAAGAALGYLMSKRNASGSKVHYPVGKISHLFVYPVKSCRGIEINQAEFTDVGIRQGTYLRDRVFMVVESNGHFLTARQEPRMVLIQPDIKDYFLNLSAPGKNPITISIKDVIANNKEMKCRVWGQNSPAVDCGDEIAEWLSTYLNHPGLRLVYFPWTSSVRTPKDYKSWGKQFKKTDSTIFGDLATCHILTEASVEDLNRRLPEDSKVTYRNFRANIVITGNRPYDEDSWKSLRIGSTVTCRVVRPCTRCVLTTINSETGVKNKDREPLETLKLYRQLSNPKDRQREGDSPVFGQFLGIDRKGVIQVGDPIEATF